MNTIAEKRQSLLQSHAHLVAEQKKCDQDDMMFLYLKRQAAGIWDQICLLDQAKTPTPAYTRGKYKKDTQPKKPMMISIYQEDRAIIEAKYKSVSKFLQLSAERLRKDGEQ